MLAVHALVEGGDARLPGAHRGIKMRQRFASDKQSLRIHFGYNNPHTFGREQQRSLPGAARAP